MIAFLSSLNKVMHYSNHVKSTSSVHNSIAIPSIASQIQKKAKHTQVITNQRLAAGKVDLGLTVVVAEPAALRLALLA